MIINRAVAFLFVSAILSSNSDNVWCEEYDDEYPPDTNCMDNQCTRFNSGPRGRTLLSSKHTLRMRDIANLFRPQLSNNLEQIEGGTICEDGHTVCYDPQRCTRYYKNMVGFVYYCMTPYELQPSWQRARRLVPPRGRSKLDIYAKNAMGQLSYTFAPPGAATKSVKEALVNHNEAEKDPNTSGTVPSLEATTKGIMNSMAAANVVKQMSSETQKGFEGAYFAKSRDAASFRAFRTVNDSVPNGNSKTFHPPSKAFHLNIDDDDMSGQSLERRGSFFRTN